MDKFLEKEFLHFDKWEGSNWERVSLTEDFSYKKNDEELIDFAIWLESFIVSEGFFKKANEFIEIMMRLKNEQEISIRETLVKRLHELIDVN